MSTDAPRRIFSDTVTVEHQTVYPVKLQGSYGMHRSYTVEIPAGESRLVLLGNALQVSPPANLGLYVESDVEPSEGEDPVRWWSIDSTAPAIDPDTKPFGYLLDYNWPNFSHDHGVALNQIAFPIPDHTYTDSALGKRAGVRKFYDTLPTFIDNLASILDPLVLPFGYGSQRFAAYAQKKSAVDLCHFGGQYLNAGVENDSGLEAGRSIAWLIGKDAYWNLGTLSDGLGFYVRFYVDVAANLAAVAPSTRFVLSFYSYPYSTTNRDPAGLPALTHLDGGGTGKVPLWGPTDLMLDPTLNKTDYPLDIAGQPAQLFNGGALSWNTTSPVPDYAPVNGCQTFLAAKADFGVTNRNVDSVEYGGSPDWSRITAGAVAVNAGANKDIQARLVNIWFGPDPGRMHDLRPYSRVDDKALWSAASVPAIGIQNPTARKATVRVEFGITENRP